jgi:tRNA modification GTPase
MTETNRVAVLTPEGTGAIATVALVGPDAWQLARRRFKSAPGRPLPDEPAPGATWFGHLDGEVADEVVLTVPPGPGPARIEIHCHGGRQVVGWSVESFRSDGCVEATWQEVQPALVPPDGDLRAWAFLPHAATTRTAAVLLDQCYGSFLRATQTAMAALDAGNRNVAQQTLAALARYAPAGRHLVEPWHVVVVGAPNVGKSSLINALAGYQRSVVAPVPGTTRDVVTVSLAFAGWPIELADTAGLHESPDELEREGMARARAALASADLCLWLLDTTCHPVGPTHRLLEEIGASRENMLFVLTKMDQKPTWDLRGMPQAVRVSSKHGDGIDELMQRVVRRLVPDEPPPGAAVPFTPELSKQVEEACRLVRAGELQSAAAVLAPKGAERGQTGPSRAGNS